MFFAKRNSCRGFLRLPGRLRQLSISGRLTLQYAVILGLTLVVYGVLVNVFMIRSVWGMIDHDLAAEAQNLYPILNPQLAASLEIQNTLLPDTSQIVSPDTRVQVIDLNGQVLLRSENMGTRVLLPNNIPELMAAGQATYGIWEGNGLWLRTYMLPLVDDGQIIGMLWVARSMETLGIALDQLQFLLCGVGIAALLVGVKWSWIAARNSLRPLDVLTRDAHSIGQAQDFSQRLTYIGPLNELGRLTLTFNEMLVQLEAAHRRTKSVLAAQRRFVADAAHELRTPLTTLRGNVGIMRRILTRVPSISAGFDDILTDMDEEFARMSRLVNDLLTLARADAGQQIVRAPVDLSEIVKTVFRQIQAQNTGLSLYLSGEDGVVISGSVDHLTQLFIILLNNAVTYTLSGGRVTLSVSRDRERAVVSVSDTGIGMRPDELSRIFDRFYRGEGARALNQDGAGLGLAIASWIVNEHRGQLRASSKPGQGSTFAVTFPISDYTAGSTS